MRDRKFLVLLTLLLPLAAQDRSAYSPATLAGRILDENNAPLPGAEVTLKIDKTERHAFASPTGAFLLDLPAPGEYSISVSLPGYFDLQNRTVAISTGSNDLTLVLSRLRERLESLDVSGVAGVIDLDKTVRDQRLSGAELLDIPYRNNTDLRNAMRALPGVVQDQQGGIHLNGGAEQQVLYVIDGFDITDPLTGTFQTRLNAEAVQSMSVLSGAVPAEYGKGAAGVVQVNTKNGDDTLRYGATNFLPGVEYRGGLTVGSWSPRVSVSGPIRKGRVWFADSLATQYAETYVRDLPSSQNRAPDWQFSNVFRTQANLTPSNILYAGLLWNLWDSPRSGLSALDPPETTVGRKSNQWFFDVKDQIYLGRGSVLEFGYASNRTFGSQVPKGTDLYLYTAFGRRGNYFVDGRQRSSRDQWMANYFLPSFQFAGSHQVKAGGDFNLLNYWQDLRRTGFIDYRANNTPALMVTYGGSGLLSHYNQEASVYLQDSWRIRPGLLLELGLRTDRDQILRNWTLAPRAAVAWSPSKGDRAKISGGYGVIYNATNLLLFTRPFDQFPVLTYYPNTGFPLTGVSSYIIDRSHFSTPRSRNFNVGWEQRFNSGFVASLQGIARLGEHGLNYSDTSGLSPDSVYRLLNTRRDQYTAVEVTFRQNMRRQYQWLASYTRSMSRSNAVIDLNGDQPLIVPDNSGRLPWDAPNRFLSWGFLPTYWKNWSLAYLTEWHSGFPFSVRDAQGLIQGNVNARRFPDFFEANLSIERQFDLGGQRWALRMGLNNLTGHRNFNLVNSQTDSPQFLQFYGAQGRVLNFRVRWLGKL